MKRLLFLLAVALLAVDLAGCQGNGWLSRRCGCFRRDEECCDPCDQPALTEPYMGSVYSSEPVMVPGPELYTPAPG